MVAEIGQKVLWTKRSKHRENVTVVPTIDVVDEATASLIIFKRNCLQKEGSTHDEGVLGVTYAVPDSP